MYMEGLICKKIMSPQIYSCHWIHLVKIQFGRLIKLLISRNYYQVSPSIFNKSIASIYGHKMVVDGNRLYIIGGVRETKYYPESPT